MLLFSIPFLLCLKQKQWNQNNDVILSASSSIKRSRTSTYCVTNHYKKTSTSGVDGCGPDLLGRNFGRLHIREEPPESLTDTIPMENLLFQSEWWQFGRFFSTGSIWVNVLYRHGHSIGLRKSFWRCRIHSKLTEHHSHQQIHNESSFDIWIKDFSLLSEEWGIFSFYSCWGRKVFCVGSWQTLETNQLTN